MPKYMLPVIEAWWERLLFDKNCPFFNPHANDGRFHNPSFQVLQGQDIFAGVAVRAMIFFELKTFVFELEKR